MTTTGGAADDRVLYVELITGRLGDDPEELTAWQSVDAAAVTARPLYVVGRGDRQTYVFAPETDLAPLVRIAAPLTARFRWWSMTFRSGPRHVLDPDRPAPPPVPALFGLPAAYIGERAAGGVDPAPVVWHVTAGVAGAPPLLDQSAEWLVPPEGVDADEYAMGKLVTLLAGAEHSVPRAAVDAIPAGSRLECVVREGGLLVGRAERTLLRSAAGYDLICPDGGPDNGPDGGPEFPDIGPDSGPDGTSPDGVGPDGVGPDGAPGNGATPGH